MHEKNKNNLIVIENGQLEVYNLDDKLVWEVGRPSGGNVPDIRLHSTTISRRHGRFQNMDGVWFYVDRNGKNGTIYQDRHITVGRNGRVKPILLKNGDVFIFGGGEEAVINHKTVWAMFSTVDYDGTWRVYDTKGMEQLTFSDGENVSRRENPKKGLVIDMERGLAIYMGDVAYLAGDMRLM